MNRSSRTHLPSRRSGSSRLLDELRAGGGVQQRLGPRAHVEVGVDDQLTDPLGRGDAARFAEQRARRGRGSERVQQLRGERRLARPVDAFDRDQPAAAHLRRSRPYRALRSRHARRARTPSSRPSRPRSRRSRPEARRRTPTCSTDRAARASGPRPARSRPSCWPRAHRIPRARARGSHPGAHPDLTWVAPSGAHEILVSDIDVPVVSAASKTPFESSCRVFVIERVDELGDEAANRMLKTLEEPASFVHLILLSDRLAEVLPTITSRCQLVRFDAPSVNETAAVLEAQGERADTALACARLALGDAEQARELTGAEGHGPAGGGRAICARGPVGRDGAHRSRGRTCSRPSRRVGTRFARSLSPARGRGDRAVPEQGAQADQDRVGGADQARPPAGRDRGARPRASGRRAVVRRPRVPGLGRPRSGEERRSHRRSRGRLRASTRNVCARRSRLWRTRACVFS